LATSTTKIQKSQTPHQPPNNLQNHPKQEKQQLDTTLPNNPKTPKTKPNHKIATKPRIHPPSLPPNRKNRSHNSINFGTKGQISPSQLRTKHMENPTQDNILTCPKHPLQSDPEKCCRSTRSPIQLEQNYPKNSKNQTYTNAKPKPKRQPAPQRIFILG
jgi:hypothetical protein